MRKPERSQKRRKAATNRAAKRNKRNTNSFKKTETIKRLDERRKAKISAEKKFKEHLSKLMGNK